MIIWLGSPVDKIRGISITYPSQVIWFDPSEPDYDHRANRDCHRSIPFDWIIQIGTI